jgi:hypothetical protein
VSKEELYQRIENNHRYHPATVDTGPKFEQVRAMTMGLAKNLVDVCPEGRELSLALTHLEEVMFWANAAIARTTPVEGA